MKPKIAHQQAMELSFRAKECLKYDNYTDAFDYYKKAAELENQVAEFYLDKPELEPTRSVIIRSAAYLNLKAGLVEEAQKLIFFGLLNLKDELIKIQLNEALEILMSLRDLETQNAAGQYNYISILRQRSVQYILEPVEPTFGKSISLEMLKDFADSYLKSLKSYAFAKYRKLVAVTTDVEEAVNKELDKLINPLITRSAYGSLKFSIANDFLKRPGEAKELVNLKANVIQKYHNEIFVNPLTKENIEEIKSNYEEEEIDNIFKPLFKIKATTTPYRIGYFDVENLNKQYIGRILNDQRKQLITVRKLMPEDIGELESSIVHARTKEGKLSKKTILKKHLRTADFYFPTREINPAGSPPIILNNEILLNVNFNSDKGFTISFEDFNLEYMSVEFEKTLSGFYKTFNDKILSIISKSADNRSGEEQRDYEFIRKYIENPEALISK